MTTTAVTRQQARGRRGLKGLAGVLTFVCIVLFLMAIEQKQAVEAWTALRDGAVPAIKRVYRWATDGAADGLDGLKTAVEAEGPSVAAPQPIVLAGAFGPADDVTRETVGGATFTGAAIRLERGETFQTRPLRIAAGNEAFNTLRDTFAGRLDASEDAQIELRAVVPHERGRPVAASALCGGATPGVVALLHRRDHVELMLFRERTIIGAEAPAEALCGVWHFRAR